MTRNSVLTENQCACLEVIDPILRGNKVDYFVVGATVIDAICVGIYGLRKPRLTRDLDLAVAVPGWPLFESIRSELVNTQRFTETSQEYRLQFDGKLSVDIIPFGGVESKGREMRWATTGQTMNLIGYAECLRNAEPQKISPRTSVKFPTLDGVFLLKLFAWNDRPAERQHDADDLVYIWKQYLNGMCQCA